MQREFVPIVIVYNASIQKQNYVYYTVAVEDTQNVWK